MKNTETFRISEIPESPFNTCHQYIESTKNSLWHIIDTIYTLKQSEKKTKIYARNIYWSIMCQDKTIGNKCLTNRVLVGLMMNIYY